MPDHERSLPSSALDTWPFAKGEAAHRAGMLDWAATPLGPRERWDARRSAAVELVLASDKPMLVVMGPDMVAVGNDALSALLGRADMPVGHETIDALSLREAIETARSAGAAVASDPIRLDGPGRRLVRISHAPLRDDAGLVDGLVSRFDPIADEETLPLESHRFRVRNMLALIRSVARRTGECATTLDDYMERFDGRLDALARVQAMLASSPTGIELWQLAGEEALVAGLREGETLEVTGPDVVLEPRAAEVVGLALHELITETATSSLWHDAEQLALTWEQGATGMLRLEWIASWTEPVGSADAGGPVLDDAFLRGFGRDVLEGMLPYELDAQVTLAIRSTNVRCLIEIPADHVVSAGAQL